jgi:hypothetical protein
MNPDDLDISLDDLIKILVALKVHVYSESHRYCFSNNIAKELDAVMKGIEDPVLGSHIQHMKVQRAALNGEN